MKSQNPFKKFDTQKEKIQTLLMKNSKFKRMYEEYDQLSENLWNLEQSEGISITDDFINYMKFQTHYLEEEITDFLVEKT